MRGSRKVAAAACGMVAVLAVFSLMEPPIRGQTPPGTWLKHDCVVSDPSQCSTCGSTGNTSYCEDPVDGPPNLIGHCVSNPKTIKTCEQDLWDCGGRYYCVSGHWTGLNCATYYICYDW
jgi:hypothetical protein